MYISHALSGTLLQTPKAPTIAFVSIFGKLELMKYFVSANRSIWNYFCERLITGSEPL
ncbi:hypothetical protein C900_04920 [Fulvivirga imtechensis AK7]|uniref:Uncharacterized protein n=1 Tax=Fulvivirga imtechensis AK7 TaxID=1237149 RepID=L8JQ76_9BACT|nr:hypothetical protein C900_04920 [Fulvivirga imtechensis AK7]